MATAANVTELIGRNNLKKSSPKIRKKLWEIGSHLHCSIIGTCCSINELEQIIRRCGLIIDENATEYDIHGSFVNMADTKCHVTKQLQKLFDTKFSQQIRVYSKARTEAELDELWAHDFDSGNIAPAYWALVTHPFATQQLIAHAHGAVHMLSHQVGAGKRVDLKRTAMLEQQCKQLNKQIDTLTARTNKQLQERDETIRGLNNRLVHAMDAERQLQFAEHRIRSFESKKETVQMRKTISELKRKLEHVSEYSERVDDKRDDFKQQIERLQEEKLDLMAEVSQYKDSVAVLENELMQLLSNEPSQNLACASSCLGRLDLCGRCVLYVGGRTGQCSHFRALVEKHNGKFIHHDGGREDGRLHLGSMLSQADAIFCPIDCVSHDAINRVKKLCEQQMKKLVMLPRASLSAFTQGLNEVTVQ